MKRFYFKICGLFLLSFAVSSFADTIERFMNIADNIPKMEMKADNDAQVWVRSARNILNLTCEAIAETLIATNKTATEQGKPLFCLNAEGQNLQPAFLNSLIQKTYREMTMPKDAKDNLTVSEVALMGVMQIYPCSQAATQSPGLGNPFSAVSGQMQHVP